ncbi:hypothetical protein FNV43_RR04477 [Rhamnella rubrinervis]|uniref:Polygalacturonase n=1 Tax=Rhamnella rubrinervis TaxID=2594499 RepID=A0A8K0HJU0_9ROSA|nr:hypothetical protein FNV43_RR04477 [Rhamnella rubrinervis]
MGCERQLLGKVVAPNTPNAWKQCGSGFWLIFFEVDNLIMDGSGEIDGQGSTWWTTIANGRRPIPIANVLLSNNARLSNLHIMAPKDSPNTDGIDISESNNVHVQDSVIELVCHLSVGSLGEYGGFASVQDVRVYNCSFTGTQNGARIKTWQVGGSGYAKKISFQKITLRAAENPIIIDQNYCERQLQQPGNNNQINTILKSNFEPYGRDFIGGQPTGRFSNGRIPTDFISEAFGIKATIPAYLDPTYDNKDFATGVCFASAGTGYDNATSDVLELDYYKEYQKELRDYLGNDEANEVLSEALYLISLGTNDFLENYYWPSSNGVSTIERTERILSGNDCIEEYNDVAKNFNEKLQGLVTKLKMGLGLQLVLSNVYDILSEIIQNPISFGKVIFLFCVPSTFANCVTRHGEHD